MRTRPDKICSIELPSGRVSVDEAGYLVDPDHWSRDFAFHVATSEGIELGDLHWDIIDFIRDWNVHQGVMPDVRFVMKYLCDRCATDKAGAKKILFDLFPYGYVKQACKMAGMKQPRAWSTG